ncbi:MAG: pyrroline-5-carboxylate reductase [Candidatus Berkiellales bacterium]
MQHKIGIIGGGNMGECLIGGLIHQGHSPQKIWVADQQEEKLSNLHNKWQIFTSVHNQKVASEVDILVLAVKPQSMKMVVEDLRLTFDPQKTLLVSIAAGITTQQIQHWLNNLAIPVIRAMPNTPALYGYGITGLYATSSSTSEQKQQAENLMTALGQTVWIHEESQMDIVTALSGSGPAYFFYFMEALINGAKSLGLPADAASKLTFYTALGSAQMVLNSQEDILSLRQKVTSPGGTTEQGIKALKDGKLPELLLNTLQAATLKGKQLSEQYG